MDTKIYLRHQNRFGVIVNVEEIPANEDFSTRYEVFTKNSNSSLKNFETFYNIDKAYDKFYRLVVNAK